MNYSHIRPLLFCFPPEIAHNLALGGLNLLHKAKLIDSIGLREPLPAAKPRSVMGLTFPNPLGLAAGLDKNGTCINALAALGFGFIEIGTVTPRPQTGNPKPRLFRLPPANAIINRMGFNNCGVNELLKNVRQARYCGILGINIGKNSDTPMEQAGQDYLVDLRAVYPCASYVAVNISSPNTKNLRELQQSRELRNLLGLLKEEQATAALRHDKYVPLALKIAPDLEPEQIAGIAGLLLEYGFDGVIATNTTLSRNGVEGLSHGDEAGGLSGAPVRSKSTAVVQQLRQELQGKIPIIGVGGIMNGQDAKEKMMAGADLVQIHTGLIYRGPELVGEIRREVG